MNSPAVVGRLERGVRRLLAWWRAAGPDLATPSGGCEAGPEEDRIEAAYWRFDARHKGYGQWKAAPMSERDAFKAEMRNALAGEKTRAQMRLTARNVSAMSCQHAEDPRGCYRVRCQLGRKCVEA